MIQYAYTILYVQDVVRAITFYEKVFGFTRRFIAPENEYGELQTGSTILSFATTTLAKTNLSEGFLESTTTGKPFGIEIGFTTNNVAQLFDEAVKAGATPVEKPKQKTWEQEVAYVRDLDGFLVEICTPME